MKEEEPIKIEIEEEPTPAENEAPDFVNEFRRFGQKFAESVETAWNSEQRQKLEADLKEGMSQFSEEVRKVFDQIGDSDAGKRVRVEVEKIDSSDLASNVKVGLANGLKWLSTELGKMSDTLVKESPDTESKDAAEM